VLRLLCQGPAAAAGGQGGEQVSGGARGGRGPRASGSAVARAAPLKLRASASLFSREFPLVNTPPPTHTHTLSTTHTHSQPKPFPHKPNKKLGPLRRGDAARQDLGGAWCVKGGGRRVFCDEWEMRAGAAPPCA
jgi:hypothetical protein